MEMDEKQELLELKETLRGSLLRTIEEAVSSRKIRMKDVAGNFGISSQVASKLVRPSDTRMPTAFETMRLSVLLRTPIAGIIPPEKYLTGRELHNKELCRALGVLPADTDGMEELFALYRKLTKQARRHLLEIAGLIREWDREKRP